MLRRLEQFLQIIVYFVHAAVLAAAAYIETFHVFNAVQTLFAFPYLPETFFVNISEFKIIVLQKCAAAEYFAVRHYISPKKRDRTASGVSLMMPDQFIESVDPEYHFERVAVIFRQLVVQR